MPRPNTAIAGDPGAGVSSTLRHKPRLLQQFGRFALVGMIGTAVHYTILIALVAAVDTDPVLATVVGFGGGAVTNYVLNYFFTFRSKERHWNAAPKFLFIATLGAGINALLMWFGYRVWGIHYLLAQVIATIVVLGWNFAMNRFWTFARDGR
jgi:putative flippase GtrA